MSITGQLETVPRRARDRHVSVTADDLAALHGGLFAFCYQLPGSPFDAEDVVQDAMERAAAAADGMRVAVTAHGHGVAGLPEIFAHCIGRQAGAANQRFTDALAT